MKTYQLLLSARATWDLPLAAKMAQAAGYDGLEIVMGGLLTEVPLARYHQPLPLPVIAVHAPYGGHNLPGFQESLADGISLATMLRAGVVNIHPPSQQPVHGDSTHIVGALKHLKALQTAHSNLVLGYEVMGKPHFGEEPFLPSDWLAHVLQHELWATLDTTHLAFFGIEPGTYVERLGPRLRHVHASDYDPATQQDHRWPGEGTIDWPRFLTALRQSPTEHLTITLEPSGKNDLVQSAEKIAASAKLVWGLLG